MTDHGTERPAAAEEREGAAGVPLEAFARAARELGPAEFAAAYAPAFFLHNGTLGAPAHAGRSDPTLVAESRHRHGSADFPFVAFAIRPPGAGGSPHVTVGRATTNDIVLADPSVSKLHALVRESPTGELAIEDARSQNGTYVDDHLVPVSGRGQPVVLRSGALVRLGSLELVYVTAEELQALARTLVRIPA